jgi:hypothetical protein
MRFVTGLILLSLVASVTPAAAQMWVDSNESADFSEYHAYTWREGTPSRSSEVQLQIQGFIERELDKKGLRKVEEGADVFILTHVLADKHTLDQLSDSGYWEFWSGVRSVSAYDLRAGTLVVDVVDATTNDLVWRGVANETVSGAADKVLKKVDKSVRKLFKSFPSE